MMTEYYKTWEEYKKEHPEIAEIPEAECLQDYEDGLYRFIFGLFL